MKISHTKNIRTLDVYLSGKRFYVVVHRVYSPGKSHLEPQGLMTQIVNSGWHDSHKTGYITISDTDEIEAFLKLSEEGTLIVLEDKVVCDLPSVQEDGSISMTVSGDYYYKDGSMVEQKMRGISGYMETAINRTHSFVAEKEIKVSAVAEWEEKGFTVAIR